LRWRHGFTSSRCASAIAIIAEVLGANGGLP
jgi:hypothetical protein